jgi:glycosyltransferase involved in cell wall biosynthesis
MNIGCDARALVGPLTGVGTWTLQVAAGLVRRRGHRIVLAASKPIALPPELEDPKVSVIPPPRVPWPGTLWLHTALPAMIAEECEVFIASLAVAPRRCPVPFVPVVHDLTPRTHPHRHTLANRFCFNAYLEESLERANAVVAGSHATEALLLETFPWLADKLFCISYGVDSFFRPAEPDDDGDDTRCRFSAGRPYILHLGTLEPRKGLPDLIDAWELLREQNAGDAPDLVLCGRWGWDTQALRLRIRSSRFGEHIHTPGYVEREHALSLLQHAEVFVVASETEGFGLPLGEAISCATPCVASDIPAFREVAGNACLFAAPHDSGALAQRIQQALAPIAAEELRHQATLRSPALRWEPIVDAWHALLTSVRSAG